jgi:hypothetical protein
MDTAVKTTEKHILLKLSNKLVKIQQELDELALQMALGKVEVKDKFEEIKQEFKDRIDDFKFTIIGKVLGMAAERMQAHFEELEEHLAEGRAETHETFKVQLTKISRTIKALEEELAIHLPENPDTDLFQYDMEKFKLKLEIIRLRYELKRIELRDAFYNSMAAARKSIKSIKQLVEKASHTGEHKIESFKNDVETTLGHIRSAIKSL